MFSIKAKVTEIKKEPVQVVNDGIHRYQSSGKLKGGHAMCFDNSQGKRFVPYGETCFYWYTRGSLGIKIFYSFSWGKRKRCEGLKDRNYITRIRKKIKYYSKLGLAPTPKIIDGVKIELEFDKQKIHKVAPALYMEHVHWSPAWENYCKGELYDWDSVDHEDHSPEGFKRFEKEIKKVKRKIDHIDAYKLSDVLWCCKKNKWQLVDVR